MSVGVDGRVHACSVCVRAWCVSVCVVSVLCVGVCKCVRVCVCVFKCMLYVYLHEEGRQEEIFVSHIGNVQPHAHKHT